MRSLQILLLIGAISLTGCEGVVIFGAVPSTTPLTVSGFVSIIQVTTIGSGGTTTTFVTAVTFLAFAQAATASTVSFCGDVGNQFVLNTFTTVTFSRGPACATIIAISTAENAKLTPAWSRSSPYPTELLAAKTDLCRDLPRC